MHLFQRGVLLAVTAGALALQPVPSQKAVAPASAHAPAGAITVADTSNPYPESAIEHYLSDAQIAFLRPGVNITIDSFTVVPGAKPEVVYYLKDDLKQPLDKDGGLTPGVISVSFIFSRWDAKNRIYMPYTGRVSTTTGLRSPGTDSGGTTTALELGKYKYVFGTAMPADMDKTATNTLGVYGNRNMTGYLQKNYYAPNVFKEMRVDGGTADKAWGAMEVTACNACHDTLGTTFHGGTVYGGQRSTPKMCAMCHNTNLNADADAKVAFHKVHMGANLPSVKGGKPYVWGGRDYSTVAYPPSTNAIDNLKDCAKCHQANAAEASIWYSRLSRAACGSCHDDIDWTTGTGHYGMPQRNDNSCINCHEVTVDAEWDDSVKGAHQIASKSTQLKGIKATVASVSNFVAGGKPTVVFKVTANDGTVLDGSKLATFSPILAGPTSDYKYYWRETGAGKAIFDAAAGTTTYTFTNAIPADETGTWAISLDAYRTVALIRGDGKPDISFRECATNPVFYQALTAGATTAARRVIVSDTRCNACHGGLALHGGQRITIQECVICHNPTMTDTAQRLPEFNPPESIDFKRMIHRIHTGEELEQEFTVYGNGKTKHNYNEVRYPGNRMNCIACHSGSFAATNTVYNLPTAGKLDTVTPRDFYTPQGPGTSACLGCHDHRDYASHAWEKTSPFGESCAACHGATSDWSPTKVHAR